VDDESLEDCLVERPSKQRVGCSVRCGDILEQGDDLVDACTHVPVVDLGALDDSPRVGAFRLDAITFGLQDLDADGVRLVGAGVLSLLVGEPCKALRLALDDRCVVRVDPLDLAVDGISDPLDLVMPKFCRAVAPLNPCLDHLDREARHVARLLLPTSADEVWVGGAVTVLAQE